MDFLVVVLTDLSDRGNESFFPALQQRLKTKLPAAYDSVIAPRWGVWSTPRYAIIDPNGILRAYTDGADLTTEKLSDLVAGREVSIRIHQNTLARYSPPKYNDSRDEAVVFRSVLSRWKGERAGMISIDRFVEHPESFPDGISFIGVDALTLYNLAYHSGTTSEVRSIENKLVYPKILVEARRPHVFIDDTMRLHEEGYYNYNLLVHPDKRRDAAFIRTVIQNDLRTVFGYDVIVEKRMMPVWRLLAKPGAGLKLASQGGKLSIRRKPLDIQLRNCDMKTLREVVFYGLNLKGDPYLDVNETGFNGNIDITLRGLITSIEDINKSLNKHGLYLQKDTLEMDVLVIRDPKKEDVSN